MTTAIEHIGTIYICGRLSECPGDRRGLYRIPGFPARAAGMAVADAGKHILIEKPLAMTAAEDRQAFLEKGRSDCSGLHDALRCLHSGTVLQQCSEQNFSPERTFRTGMVLSICVFPC